MKAIAVIMSIYKNDNVNYVKQSVESILNQSYKDFDFYIQYDGFIDQEVDAFISTLLDERIIVRRRNENQGLAFSLNELLLLVLSSGYKYIARMDADDVSILNRFEKQVSFLEKHFDIDLVGGAINEIDENGNYRGKITKYPCEPKKCRAFFAKRNPVAHPTVMFRKRFFDKIGCLYPTDYKRNEDTRLWHEGYKHGCVISNLPDVLLNFRVTDTMFKQRRNGVFFAKKQLELRKIIAKDLKYGNFSLIYAYATYILMISPSWILKLAYKFFR